MPDSVLGMLTQRHRCLDADHGAPPLPRRAPPSPARDSSPARAEARPAARTCYRRRAGASQGRAGLRNPHERPGQVCAMTSCGCTRPRAWMFKHYQAPSLRGSARLSQGTYVISSTPASRISRNGNV